MRADQEFDSQPAAETDPYSDPEYVAWSARLEGESDHDNGIHFIDGYRKLVVRGADKDEINAYMNGWSRGALLAIARDAGILEHCEVV